MSDTTKGKWFISSSTLVVDEKARIIANTTPMLEVSELCIDLAEAIANARLIAAAPDLLAVCKDMMEDKEKVEANGGIRACQCIAEYVCDYCTAKIAIDKATE